MRSISHSLKSHTSQSGFTLLEISLVMVILAIFAGALLTNMSAGYSTIALDSDAEGLSGNIQAAQEYARWHRCISQLSIDVDRNEYSFSSAASEDQPYKTVNGLGNTIRLSQGVRFAKTTKLKPGTKQGAKFKFFPDGTAEPARIILQSRAGEERTLEIGELAGIPLSPQ